MPTHPQSPGYKISFDVPQQLQNTHVLSSLSNFPFKNRIRMLVMYEQGLMIDLMLFDKVLVPEIEQNFVQVNETFFSTVRGSSTAVFISLLVQSTPTKWAPCIAGNRLFLLHCAQIFDPWSSSSSHRCALPKNEGELQLMKQQDKYGKTQPNKAANFKQNKESADLTHYWTGTETQ